MKYFLTQVEILDYAIAGACAERGHQQYEDLGSLDRDIAELEHRMIAAVAESNDAPDILGVTLLDGTFERLALQPGDAVIARIDARLTSDQAQRIEHHIKTKLKIHKVLVIDRSATLSIKE